MAESEPSDSIGRRRIENLQHTEVYLTGFQIFRQ